MYRVPTDLPGRLWIMPLPDPECLEEQIAQFRAAGMDHLVSMLVEGEAAALGLAKEAEACAATGLSFHTHPIADFGLSDMGAFSALTQQIASWLAQGQGVGVHCRAGIGRSGMVTAGVLMAIGQPAAEAIKIVSASRKTDIPDTVEQGNFLFSFEKELRI